MPLIEMVNTFNPSPREVYKTVGNSSNTQSLAKVPKGRITISDCGRGKSQWLDGCLHFESLIEPQYLTWYFY